MRDLISVLVISNIENPINLGLSFLYQVYPQKEMIIPEKYIAAKLTIFQLLFGHLDCFRIVEGDEEEEQCKGTVVVKIHGTQSLMLPTHLSFLMEFYQKNPTCQWTFNTRKIVHKKYWFKPSLLNKKKADFLEDIHLDAFGIAEPYVILKTSRNEVYRDPIQISHRHGVIPGNAGFGDGTAIESPTVVTFE
jgi:hypothetical protein